MLVRVTAGPRKIVVIVARMGRKRNPVGAGSPLQAAVRGDMEDDDERRHAQCRRQPVAGRAASALVGCMVLRTGRVHGGVAAGRPKKIVPSSTQRAPPAFRCATSQVLERMVKRRAVGHSCRK